MLDAGLQYAMERKAFGEPIANFQLIQAMLADSKAEIYAADCMLNDASARADRGEKILVEAAATKMFASELCGRVADRVVLIHGGAGYLKGFLDELFYRESPTSHTTIVVECKSWSLSVDPSGRRLIKQN